MPDDKGYHVAINITASTSNYWVRLAFVDSKGKLHERIVEADRKASKNSNHLQALIDAIRVLNRSCMLDIYTSCEYIIEPFKQGWINTWEKNNWTTAKGKLVRNADQWKIVRKALEQHAARFLYKDGRE